MSGSSHIGFCSIMILMIEDTETRIWFKSLRPPPDWKVKGYVAGG
ncbi:hypothetical protein BMS3Abin02_00654 [bacterium BMS3Abin02]|nr:hypothetical protein BMS3Abin02_00654 [bacterium BMS3Abin02]GBE23417.1 hypothetical protein BMS3Bbin01_02801 [bacterium BMS3Bbin01]